MTAALLTGLAVVLGGSLMLLLALRRGREADDQRADARAVADLAWERARGEVRERVRGRR